jgi:hypothetical protein
VPSTGCTIDYIVIRLKKKQTRKIKDCKSNMDKPLVRKIRCLHRDTRLWPSSSLKFLKKCKITRFKAIQLGPVFLFSFYLFIDLRFHRNQLTQFTRNASATGFSSANLIRCLQSSLKRVVATTATTSFWLVHQSNDRLTLARIIFKVLLLAWFASNQIGMIVGQKLKSLPKNVKFSSDISPV